VIGNYVNLILRDPEQSLRYVVLHKIDVTGVTVAVTQGIPEAQGNRFFPMARVVEVVDTGRRP
jgi:hypothetical protein